MSDIEKLKEFMVSNKHNAEEVKTLNDDDPINLLIKAAYGLTDCERVRGNKLAFNEKFLHLYAYLIVAVHRAIFEQGKCVKELLEIMNYLEPYDYDSRVLRNFYIIIRAYPIMERNSFRLVSGFNTRSAVSLSTSSSPWSRAAAMPGAASGEA